MIEYRILHKEGFEFYRIQRRRLYRFRSITIPGLWQYARRCSGGYGSSACSIRVYDNLKDAESFCALDRAQREARIQESAKRREDARRYRAAKVVVTPGCGSLAD